MIGNARRSLGAASLVLLVGLVAWLAPAPADGHEKHRPPAPAAGDSGRVGGDARLPGASTPPTSVPEGAEPPYAMPPIREMLFHHVHNKLVHLPIVLAPVALVLLLADRRRPGSGIPFRLFVWAAALSAAFAFIAGRAQVEPFLGGPKEWLAGTHERWGTAAMVLLLAWALLSTWPKARGRLGLIGAVATVVTFVAAFYGGLVAHG
ncbi:MAG TPA: hypothetical protein VFT32_09905 [Candidatus Eisenbacteria bacterium]|nr:hypothetical protein [Candidatus Eisenbacteria bacterium]